VLRDADKRTNEPTSQGTSLDAEALIAIVERAPDAILVVDESGTIEFANATALEMFGYERTALVGQPVEFLVPDQLRTQHRWDRAEYLEDPRHRAMGAGLELHARCADGSELEVDVSLAPIEARGRRLVVAAVRDATGRHEAEEAHLELMTIVERQLERERLAADIHDDLIQSVYAIGLGLLEAARDEETSKADALERARTQVSEVIADLRSYVYWLRSQESASRDQQITSRIESLLRGIATGVEWKTELRIPERELPPEHQRHTYLVAKELISNVHRHAEAAHAEIAIVVDGGVIQVAVRDDGDGFDPREAADGSFGLSGIRQRAASLGGSVTIDSARGVGTEVCVRLPLPEPQQRSGDPIERSGEATP
jgi:PAS domain S-box-containing protein